MSTIPFIDLGAQRKRIGANIDARVQEVLQAGRYINGPEVKALETALGDFGQVPYVVGCASGTDALYMVLLAKNIGPGDAIFVPAYTFISTAEVVALTGATPVFVDVDYETFNISVESLKAAIQMVKAEGALTPKGIIPVDLFGLPADYAALMPVAQAEDLWVMCDSAQAFGATTDGTPTVAQGDVATTSFFPAKPLGGYGDGGAIFTHDEGLYKELLSVRVHGQGANKYDNVRLGVTGRIDTIQAAILLEKLKIYPDEIEARQRVAQRYTEGLQDCVTTPAVPKGARSVWAQYTLKTPCRDAIIQHLKGQDIPTMVYYNKPLTQQLAYTHYPVAPGGVPVAEGLCHEVVSLPMHPYLLPDVQDKIIGAVRAAVENCGATCVKCAKP